MQLKDRYYKITRAPKKPVTLEFVESFFKAHQIRPVRWAIIEVRKEHLLLSAVVAEG
jgi:hypothetical protein